MRYITLTKEEQKELEQLYTHGKPVVERKRSQCILLSHAGKSIKELAVIFGVKRLSITKWLDKWQAGGKSGILLQTGRGRKKKLASLDQAPLEQYVTEHNRNLDAVVALLKEKHGVAVSKKTWQRFLKIQGLLL